MSDYDSSRKDRQTYPDSIEETKQKTPRLDLLSEIAKERRELKLAIIKNWRDI